MADTERSVNKSASLVPMSGGRCAPRTGDGHAHWKPRPRPSLSRGNRSDACWVGNLESLASRDPRRTKVLTLGLVDSSENIFNNFTPVHVEKKSARRSAISRSPPPGVGLGLKQPAACRHSAVVCHIWARVTARAPPPPPPPRSNRVFSSRHRHGDGTELLKIRTCEKCRR